MIVKRLLDTLSASVGLVLLSPVIAVVAVLVRLDSEGPIFFAQTRVGQEGKLFRILKFRTMRHVQSMGASEITQMADNRITRAGHFLRTYKIDEVPQLWNVLRGDMSLVGPRPEVPRYVEVYPADVRRLVLSVKPGMTDIASMRFRTESTLLGSTDDAERMYVDRIIPAKLAFYRRYVESRSMWKDLAIIFATLGIIAGGVRLSERLVGETLEGIQLSDLPPIGVPDQILHGRIEIHE